MLNPIKPDERTSDCGAARALAAQGRCPGCRYQIHVMEGSAYAVIKAAVIKADTASTGVYGKFPKCKCWLIMPLSYQGEKTSR